MKPVKVTWGIYQYDPSAHGTLNGSVVINQVMLLKKLRAAGIPVIGEICVEGVEYGTLTVETDRTFGDHTWVWVPGEPPEELDPAAGL